MSGRTTKDEQLRQHYEEGEPGTEDAGDGEHALLASVRSVRVADVKAERVRWLWPGRLPRGKLVAFDGDPSLGKSTLSLDLAARVSTGSPMPGETVSTEGAATVVLLSAEDGIGDTIRPRLEAAGADLNLVHVLTEVLDTDDEGKVTARPPSIPDDVARLEALVISTGAVLVVVDVLNAYLGARVDGHRDQDVRRALQRLAAMAERTGAVVVVIRHLNKSAGGNALYRGGGSIGIIGAARAGLIVAIDPDDETRRVLAVTKSNLAAMPTALAYRLVPDEEHGCARVRWEGPTEHRANDLLATRGDDENDDGADAAAALASILRDGPLWVKECIEAMAEAGFTKDQARRAKDRVGRSVKRGRPGDAEQGWKWELRHHQRTPEGGSEPPEGGEDGSTQNPATFATFGTDLPSSENGRSVVSATSVPAEPRPAHCRCGRPLAPMTGTSTCSPCAIEEAKR